MRIRTFALAALLVAGCHWNLNDKGTEPQTAQLYFPSGIAMDPAGQFVYVSNGNADLRYGGGTVMMIDMLSFECTAARYRQQHPLSDADAATTLPAACPARDWDAIANTIVDNTKNTPLCMRDPLDPSIIDCDESAFILQNSTVKIGNFAGAIRVVRDPPNPKNPDTDSGHRSLFVAVRGDPSITKIDVNLPGSTPSAPASTDDPGILNCVTNAQAQALATRAGYDPKTQRSSTPIPCDASKLIQDFDCQGQPSCMVGTDQANRTQLPTEPFAMKVDSTNRLLLVSHLATGQVSVIDVDTDPSMALLSESQPFFPADATGRHGAFGLAQQHVGDAGSTWYVTSSVNPQIATFRVGESKLVIPQTVFGINSSFAQGGDVRDISFDVDGNRAFITENNPPSVLVMDTRPVANSGNQNLNLITDVVDVCQTPSHMGVRRLAIAGADGTPTQIKTKLVVVCFLSSQVMIVDPDRPGVDDTIFSGFSGPNDVAFNFSSFGESNPIQQLEGRHAYVTNYSESTIAVVDLEPNSPTENRVVARLGMPVGGNSFNP